MTAGLGLAAAAQAQVFSYTDLNLILVVRDDAGVKNDLEFNLGSVNNLTGLAATTSGQLGYVLKTTDAITGGSSGVNIANQIRSVYGNTLPSGLDITVFASSTATSGANKKALWLSATRTGDVSGVSGSTPWQADVSTAQGPVAGNIKTIAQGATAYTTAGAANPTIKTTFASIPASSSSSYTTLSAKNGTVGQFAQTFGGGNVETTSKGGLPSNLDFYSLNPSNVGNDGVYLGFFTLDKSANLYFTPAGSVVPEPRSYALMGALGLVGFGLWRRRASK